MIIISVHVHIHALHPPKRYDIEFYEKPHDLDDAVHFAVDHCTMLTWTDTLTILP